MRQFSYITLGRILETLKQHGVNITRVTLYNLEAQGVFLSKRLPGRWRVYSEQEADIIVYLVLEYYRKNPSRKIKYFTEEKQDVPQS